MLRGAGDMLGFIQSGIKSGYAVDLAHHWEMLPAASLLATSFLQHFDRGIHTHYNESMGGSQKANDSLLKLHQEGKVKAFYDETNAASESGFALRVMLLLFGERNCDNLKESLNILATLNGQSQNDTLISKKILEIADFAGSINSPEINQVEKTTSISRKPVASQKPRMLTTTKNAVNFLDDVCFILLDVETTGLDAVSSHVIQLAGKELGSGPDDEFAEYILPPPTVKVPKKIEDLTGITDDFLRNGKFKVFNEVYHEFQDFCIQQANGRNVCFVAHNAKFDIGMIESELRRWRTVDKSAPVLADIFASSLDTISLFRERRLWTTSNVVKPRLEQPSSFKLGDIYYHVFNENMDNAHNAVGDVRALERLLLSNHFADWKIIGNKMQRPFIKVT
jgi:DNA polymerase III epsilon subunit-like protein